MELLKQSRAKVITLKISNRVAILFIQLMLVIGIGAIAAKGLGALFQYQESLERGTYERFKNGHKSRIEKP
jgi:hypothetical protein